MSKIKLDDKGRKLYKNEYQRKDGRYLYKYYDTEGNIKYLYSWKLEDQDKNSKGKQGCKALREMESEIKYSLLWESKGLNISERITVIELVDCYLSMRINVKPATLNGYRLVRKTIVRDTFGDRKIDRVSVSDAKRWLVSLQANGKGYSSIHNIRGVLNPAFQMAVEDGLIERNPFDFKLASIIVNDTQKREALTIKEEQDFLEFIHNDGYYSRYFDMVYVLFNTGIRVSEMCGLTMDDIDFQQGYISIRRTLNRFNREYVMGSPKTTSGTRKIPMSNEVRTSLERIVKCRKHVEQKVSIGAINNLLFLDTRGMPLLPNMVEKYFQRIRELFYKERKYEIYVTPHICRHTFCTKMVREGMKPKVLQYLMGHSRIDTTLEYYAHIDYDQVKLEVEKIMNN